MTTSLNQLSRKDKELLLSVYIEKAKRHLLDFCSYTFPRYLRNKHLGVMAEKLEAVERGEIKRLLFTWPPRHGKSELVSRKFPAWYLGRNPDKRVILTTYEATFSESLSRDIRETVESKKFELAFNVATPHDSRSVSNWNLVGHRGGLLARGVGGAITGHGANLFIIDDPIKNREEAESEVYRERVWNWYLSVVRTRLEPDASIVGIMTRWHSDDLFGRLIEKGGFEVINLPAIAEEDDYLGREIGEALWPERYNEEDLAQTEIDVGSRVWSSLYQGNPLDPETQIVKREWIRWYDELPPTCVRAGGIDTATSKKTSADNMAFVDACRDPEGYIYIDDVFCEKTSVKAFAEHVCNQHKIKHYSTIHIEENAAGEAVKQRIDEEGLTTKTYPPVIGFVTEKDKTVRVMEVQPLIENGTVKFRKGNAKVAQLVENLVKFPQATVDDDVDGCVFAIKAVMTGILNEDDIELAGDDRDMGEAGLDREDSTDFGMEY